MKQLLCIFLSFFIFPAFAVTSESYVDSAVASLQDEIPAVNTNTVLTNTGIAGEIGTKKIYDSTQDFGTQTNALVTAETFNAAVQNAIDNEYVCVEWLGEHVPGNCLLWQIRPVYHKSKNLFDINNARVLFRSGTIQETKTATGYILRRGTTAGGWQFVLIEIGNISDLLGKTLRLSVNTDCKHPRSQLGYSDDNGKNRITGDPTTITVEQQTDAQTKVVLWLYAYAGTDEFCSEYSNIQIEEGSVATPYVPYGNVYMPKSNE